MFLKKLVLVSILAVSLILIHKKEVYAQASSCPNTTTGCIVCVYSDATQLCESGPTQGGTTLANSCAPGANPPSADLFTYCRSQPVSSCLNQPIFVDCIPNAGPPKGGYYCITDQKTCQQCDLDPNTSIPECPGGADPQFSGPNASTDCFSFCNQTSPLACNLVTGATCITTSACPAQYEEVSGSCPVNSQRCCRSIAGNEQGCQNQGGTCRSSCGTTELGGTSSFCPTGKKMCCIPNLHANVTTFQGSCSTTSGTGIDTAIGCIPIGDLNAFAIFFLRWGLGIAGGVGFLFLIYASFQVMTSQGDPKRLQTGRELLTSAVSGIVLLVFSVFVLRILGVNVLGIF